MVPGKFLAALMFFVAAFFLGATPVRAGETPVLPDFPGAVRLNPGDDTVWLSKESAEAARDFYVAYARGKGFGSSVAGVTDRIDGFEALKGYEMAIFLNRAGGKEEPFAVVTVLVGDEELFNAPSPLGPGLDLMKSTPFPPFSHMLLEAGDSPAREEVFCLMGANGRLRYSFFRNVSEGGRLISERDWIINETLAAREPDRGAAWNKAIGLINERAYPTMIKIARQDVPSK